MILSEHFQSTYNQTPCVYKPFLHCNGISQRFPLTNKVDSIWDCLQLKSTHTLTLRSHTSSVSKLNILMRVYHASALTFQFSLIASPSKAPNINFTAFCPLSCWIFNICCIWFPFAQSGLQKKQQLHIHTKRRLITMPSSLADANLSQYKTPRLWFTNV